MNIEITHIISVVVVLFVIFLLMRKKPEKEKVDEIAQENTESQKWDDELEDEVQTSSEQVSSQVSNILKNKEKRRVKSKKGYRLNKRNQRPYDDFDDTLFDMTFPSYYHPYRMLYLHDWFFDNDLVDEDNFYIELEDDLGFAGAVLAEVYFNDHGVRVIDFLDANESIISAAVISSSGELTVNGMTYHINDETGEVTIDSEDNSLSWSDEDGYSIDSSLSDESIHVNTEGDVEFSSDEKEYAQEESIVAHETVESTEYGTAEPTEYETTQPTEYETAEPTEYETAEPTRHQPVESVVQETVSESHDVSSSVDSSSDNTDY